VSWFNRFLLALVTWREARGEGNAGMRAVMHVIANRVKAWRSTYAAVICGKDQFSSMSVLGDPGTIAWPAPADPEFLFCFELAETIEGDSDPTLGSLYYENPTLARSPWFQTHVVDDPGYELKATIGRQNFYGPKVAA
jgi:hypothetical protein